MIAKLTGKIDTLKPTEAIIDINGVGYQLHIPFITYEEIKDLSETSLFVHTLHKEDQFKLFGFHNENLKEIFVLLLNVNGIGPSMGIAILSGISIERLIDSVKTENTSYLVKIPGIGKAKAEKLIFELKRKIDKLAAFSTGEQSYERNNNSDAVEALISLGFDEKKSINIVEDILRNNKDISIEDLIKESLKLF